MGQTSKYGLRYPEITDFVRNTATYIQNLAEDIEDTLEEYEPSSGGGDTLPIGTILAFSGDTAPEDFLFCRGQAVSRTTYSELFEVIGTQYGSGDGSTTFNLPDYCGKVAVGLDSNDTDFDTLGETGGEKTHTLTVDEMPSHDHTMQNHVLAYKGGGIDSSTSGIWKSSLEKTNSTGGSQAHNILQPYIVQNFIIKFKKTTITDGEVIQETDTATTENVYSASAVNNKLSNINGTVLWTNPNPTADFEPQNITLSSSDYDVLEWYFNANVQSTSKPGDSNRVLKGFGTRLNSITGNVMTYREITRNSDTSFSVGAGYSGDEAQNRRCVPLYVVGYKTGLFS